MKVSKKPKNITIETTNLCQLKCPVCATSYSWRRERGYFSLEMFTKIMEQIDWSLNCISFGWSGEPLLNRDLFAMIKMASQRKFFTHLNTNGMLLERYFPDVIDSGLRKICIDVYGLDQHTMIKYRIGGNFQQVISGIKKLVAERDRCRSKYPIITIETLVTKDTESLLDDFIQFGKELGVDEVGLKSFNLDLGGGLGREQIYSYAERYLPENPKFCRYKKEGDNYTVKSGLSFPCNEVSSGITILFTGDVVPCCIDFEGKYIMGNIQENRIEEIWLSERYAHFRREVELRRPTICQNCSYPDAAKYNQSIILNPKLKLQNQIRTILRYPKYLLKRLIKGEQ